MRVLSELIEEVRFNTNNTDINRFSDAVLIRFFNSAQRHIQREIFLANPENNIFNKQKEINLVDGTESYKLPSNIWGYNSVASAALSSSTSTRSGKNFKPLKKLTYKERARGYGYIIYNKRILLTPIPTAVSSNVLILNYQAKLDNLEKVTDESELPDVVEEYFMAYVERKIQYVDSSNDFTNANFLTKEEKLAIKELFAENNQDVQYPPIVDDSYVTY